jgi:hypothetical protein
MQSTMLKNRASPCHTHIAKNVNLCYPLLVLPHSAFVSSLALLPACMQVIMSVLIFGLLSSIKPEEGSGRTRADEVRNGTFSTIAFVLGALTSILSGYLGMRIATFANARTALEARSGIAPAFMAGERNRGEESWVAGLEVVLVLMVHRKLRFYRVMAHVEVVHVERHVCDHGVI